MKHSSLLLLAAMGLGLLACHEPIVPNPSIEHGSPAAFAAAGEYIGQWTRISSGDTLVADGSIVFGIDTVYYKRDSLLHRVDEIENDGATYYINYLSRLHFVSAYAGLNDWVNVNIAYANEGFSYFNTSSDNELQQAIYGRIDENGTTEVSFTMTKMVNRRVKKFTFHFRGTRP